MRFLRGLVFAVIVLNLTVSIYSQHYNQLNIVNFVGVNFKTNSGYYKVRSWEPDFSAIERAMAASQARYDRGFNIVQQEYQRYINLQLINEGNIKLLEQLREIMNPTIKGYYSWDWSNADNVNNAIKYITSIYKYKTISKELVILNSCYDELSRIKKQDPDNYIYSKRYESIIKTLKILETCSMEEMENLSWQNTELKEVYEWINIAQVHLINFNSEGSKGEHPKLYFILKKNGIVCYNQLKDKEEEFGRRKTVAAGTDFRLIPSNPIYFTEKSFTISIEAFQRLDNGSDTMVAKAETIISKEDVNQNGLMSTFKGLDNKLETGGRFFISGWSKNSEHFRK